MAGDIDLAPGFADYGRDANATFRTCLTALSRPGLILPLAADVPAPPPLLATAAAVLLTLADYETSVWLDEPLSASEAVRNCLRFHTGARLTSDPGEAGFAVVSQTARMPELSSFDAGTPEYPDRSTTLIVQVDALAATGLTLTGPGIDGAIRFSPDPAPDQLAQQLTANRGRFPCGVDLIFVTGTQMAALPRSVVVKGEE